MHQCQPSCKHLALGNRPLRRVTGATMARAFTERSEGDTNRGLRANARTRVSRYNRDSPQLVQTLRNRS